MRVSRFAAGSAVATLMAMVLYAVPAHATVHEIVAQWCSGQAPLDPHGVSRPGSKNFAQPLNATGVVIVSVDVPAQEIHISFDYGNRPVKVQKVGEIPIGVDPDTGFTIVLDLIGPDPNFPAFQRCPKLNS
jgi:hypothetical protein